MRGHNLKHGATDGDKGRRLGGEVALKRPAPADCQHCADRGYTSMAQHLGHRGLARAAANRGVSVDRWNRHLIAVYDPVPWNGAHSQWLIEELA